MEEYAREPCPWRIVDDCGGAFTMGVIGGGVFQAIKGFRNAPVGPDCCLKLSCLSESLFRICLSHYNVSSERVGARSTLFTAVS
uniref:Translocase of inner mitochondrial membrane 17B n=1 Tax=Ovis aries TaxID=9940 RepID=A0AC11EH31_SHEEP